VADAPRLVFVGNVVVDLVMAIDALPESGGDVLADSAALSAGGGLNVMLAARRDGIAVVFAGRYGTGPFGDLVHAALVEGGIETVHAPRPDRDSGFTVALVDATAERTFVTSAGAEGTVTRDDLDRVPVTATDLVYVSGYTLAHPVNAAALPGWLAALPGRTRVILDPCPLIESFDPALVATVLERTDVLSANAREARLMTGAEDLPRAATLLAARTRGGTAIVRDGATGCWVAAHGVDQSKALEAAPSTPRSASEPTLSSILVPGFPVHAVDTNGAGDTHGGVLAAALARGDDILTAARRANAAAALAVTRRGPATAPTASEIDALLAALGSAAETSSQDPFGDSVGGESPAP
jgi:sugar/nucleoside kinase (ribokinase family)